MGEQKYSKGKDFLHTLREPEIHTITKIGAIEFP